MPAISPQDLRDLPLFAGLMPGEKDTLFAGGRLRHLAKDQVLFHYGTPVTHFYIVVKGPIQLVRTMGDGHEKTINLLRSGQALGEGEIMDSCRTHRASAIAVEDAEVMEFAAGWLKQAAQNHGTFALNLLSSIAQQAHLAEVEAEQQATMSAAQLAACFLQRLCVLYDFDHRGFELPYSKTIIASRLGMELETFSRTLAKLKERGIEVNGTHVVIRDLAKVEEYVCGFCSVAGDCQTHQTLKKYARGERVT